MLESGYRISEMLAQSILHALENGDFTTGYCMCGSPVDGHGIGDGHAPVDAGVHYAMQTLEDLRKCLNQE